LTYFEYPLVASPKDVALRIAHLSVPDLVLLVSKVEPEMYRSR